jgi:HD superfamily phosphodiesterase
MFNLKGAKKYIINRLEKELSHNLYYHGLHHTLDVYEHSLKISEREGVVEENADIISTAALYHDAGFLFRYLNNEMLAVQLVEEVLPFFGYSTKNIEIISAIILATRIDKKPQNLFEKIMCDADCDYLGRGNDRALKISKTLHFELTQNGFSLTEAQWNAVQLKFLQKHEYYTASSLKLRRPNKLKYYEYLKSLKD